MAWRWPRAKWQGQLSVDSLSHLLLSALLISLLVGGWYMERQFRRTRESYRRLEALLLALAQAERRAQQSLQALNSKTAEVESHMGARVHRISRLVDQLELMSRAGDALALRIAQSDRTPVA